MPAPRRGRELAASEGLPLRRGAGGLALRLRGPRYGGARGRGGARAGAAEEAQRPLRAPARPARVAAARRRGRPGAAAPVRAGLCLDVLPAEGRVPRAPAAPRRARLQRRAPGRHLDLRRRPRKVDKGRVGLRSSGASPSVVAAGVVLAYEIIFLSFLLLFSPFFFFFFFFFLLCFSFVSLPAPALRREPDEGRGPRVPRRGGHGGSGRRSRGRGRRQGRALFVCRRSRLGGGSKPRRRRRRLRRRRRRPRRRRRRRSSHLDPPRPPRGPQGPQGPRRGGTGKLAGRRRGKAPRNRSCRCWGKRRRRPLAGRRPPAAKPRERRNGGRRRSRFSRQRLRSL